jgi:hypothetical protein
VRIPRMMNSDITVGVCAFLSAVDYPKFKMVGAVFLLNIDQQTWLIFGT